jgi:hypothetical protein
MKTHTSLRHVTMRTSGSVGSHRRESPRAMVLARTTRGILVLALMLGSLGVAALASRGHVSAGQVHASTHQPADSPALSTGAESMSSRGTYRPWMY